MKNSMSILAIASIIMITAVAKAQDKVVVVPLGKKPKGDAAAADVLKGKTFSNKNEVGVIGSMVNNGAITLTPGTTNQNVPEGYHNGSGSVTGDANLIPENIKTGATIFGVTGTSIEASGTASPDQVLSGQTFSNASGPATGTMTNVGTQNIIPGTAAQTIEQGYHNGSGSVSGDNELVPGNIKSGVNIFGVAGNSNVVNTSTGDAAAGEILDGMKAWVDGTEVTGTMTNVGEQNITPGATAQSITQGYHNGSGSVAGDADLVSGNIIDGVNIFGITGTKRVSMVVSGNGNANLSAAPMDNYLREGDVVFLESVFGGYLKDDGDSTVSTYPGYRYKSQTWAVEINPNNSGFMFRNLDTNSYLSISSLDGVHTGAIIGDGSEASFTQTTGLFGIAVQSTFDYKLHYSQPQNISTGECLRVSTWNASDDTIVPGDCTVTNDLWRFVILNE